MKDSCLDNKSPDATVTVFPSKMEITGFFREILDKGFSLRVRVTGRSMAPFLKGGEVVTIKKVPPSELRRGDLIFSVGHPGVPLLHRIVRRKRTGKGKFVFHTRGDAVRSFDAPVRQDEILGKVCKIEPACPGSEEIQMNSRLQRKKNYLRALVSLFESYCYYGCMRLLRRRNFGRRDARSGWERQSLMKGGEHGNGRENSCNIC